MRGNIRVFLCFICGTGREMKHGGNDKMRSIKTKETVDYDWRHSYETV